MRPTVTDQGAPLLEVFLFDFDATLYGRRMEVEFLHKLRDEARFPDLDALSARCIATSPTRAISLPPAADR